jgi:hypothetical protein
MWQCSSTCRVCWPETQSTCRVSGADMDADWPGPAAESMHPTWQAPAASSLSSLITSTSTNTVEMHSWPAVPSEVNGSTSTHQHTSQAPFTWIHPSPAFACCGSCCCWLLGALKHLHQQLLPMLHPHSMLLDRDSSRMPGAHCTSGFLKERLTSAKRCWGIDAQQLSTRVDGVAG